MKLKYLLLTVLSLIFCASCNAQNSGTNASLKIQPNAAIEVSRVHIHAFLAEYDRFLSLKVNGKTAAELRIATDTGGYSRANVYSTNSDSIFVVEDLMGRYEVNIKNKQITKLEDICENPKDNIFIGAFDTDESKQWQFISALKRKQIPIERGCVEEIK